MCLSIIKNRLAEKGLNGRVAARKPYIRAINKQKRIAWAKAHESWTLEQWHKVLWSDESKFELFGSNRRVYVRRRPGERFHDNCLVPTVKHGGGSVMVWGCFGGKKCGDLKRINGILKKEGYHSILVRHAVPSGLRTIGKNFVFQEDNDPKHSSNLCRNYLASKEGKGVLQRMEWPPQSPDLNPIELLWDELDRKVKAKTQTNIDELFQNLQEAWREIEETTLVKLIERMPRLCKAVLKAKGGHFDESKI